MNALPKKIIDCFVFNDELDLLDIRLNELSPYVDLFVLVEANTTFTGQDKPYHYRENKEGFTKFNDKILHIKVEDMPAIEGPGNWEGEIYQRNAISDTVHYLFNQEYLDFRDIVILSDVDEIPEMHKLIRYIDTNGINTPITLNMEQRPYYLNTKQDAFWAGSVLTSTKEFMAIGSQWLRDHRFDFPSIPNGWHFTYQGGFENILSKINDVVDAKETMDKFGLSDDDIKINFEKGIDLFGRTNNPSYITDDIPKFVATKPYKFYHMLKDEQ